jgi:hypothetical protein
MLFHRDPKYFDEVVAFAKKVGLSEKKNEDDNSSLKSRLDYLDHYGGDDNTRVHLGRDFAPYSFSFVIERKSAAGDWRCLFEGGLLFHGAHDGGGNGSAPALAVCMTPTTGWSVHT